MKFPLLCSLLFFIVAGFSQKKSFDAFKIENSISIDGKMDEPEWISADIADGFIENSPNPGLPVSDKTEVRVLYSNNSLFLFAKMYDSAPDSIMKQFTERDEIGIVDWFGIIIDAYRDGNNAVGFFTTAAGVQYDLKYSAAESGDDDGVFAGDENWDAVWDSEISFFENGWQVEMEIPYAALRFPEGEEQKWNVNFARMVRRFRQQSFWNPVDPNNSKLLFQSGEMTDIKNIEAPLRLFVTPFLVTYLENYYDQNSVPKSSWGRSIGGGMDVKYGINDAFTLDMSLIPDFGEAQSDNQVLNLSPFEVRFDENRQFFTEGVELFNKGNFFYSRRVGGQPINYYNIETTDNDSIVENPIVTQLYNATKISGRTSKGLGIGFFNAVSAPTDATLENTKTGEQRKVETSPLTNYNVVSFDQNLKNNSYLTLINTNVMRSGSVYDANVTGSVFEFFDKKRTYSASGKVALSQQYFQDSISLGNSANLELKKVAGQFRWEAGYNQESVNYDINDLGIIFAPNERKYYGSMNYNDYKPRGKFNRRWAGFSSNYGTLYAPNNFTEFGVNLNIGAVTRNFMGVGLWAYTELKRGHDYFGPRTFDWQTFYEQPRFALFGGFISSDYRKKLAYDLRFRVGAFENSNQGQDRYSLGLNFLPRIRVNDKLSFIGGIEIEQELKELDWTTTLDDGTIIYARRDQKVLENSLRGNYAFTNNINLSFRMRHYWGKVVNYDFFTLEKTGGQLVENDYEDIHDTNFNAFNIDAIFRWRFAPGSDFFIIWKNTISGTETDLMLPQNYFENTADRLLNLPQSNSISVKLNYFLQYPVKK